MTSDERPAKDLPPETGGTKRAAAGAAEARSPSPDDSRRDDGTPDDDGLAKMLAAIAEQVGEIRSQLERLLNIQLDRLRLRVRAGLVWMLSGILFAAVCVAATIAAILYLLDGVAGAFTVLFQGRAWAGNLAAGGSVLLVVLLAVGAIGRKHRRKDLDRLRRKYETDAAKGEAR